MTRVAAIVDYGLGNLYSVKHACAQVGLTAEITADASQIRRSAVVILPGVGAFPDAMAELISRGLVSVLRDVARAGVPVVGICLGMQLMMTESDEFDVRPGLGLVDGRVQRLECGEADRRVKVPHVGWSEIHPVRPGLQDGTPLEGVPLPSQMYFVHSFAVRPADESIVVTRTTYGRRSSSSTPRHNNFAGWCSTTRASVSPAATRR